MNWKSKEKFNIKGRGDVYTINLKENGYLEGVHRDKISEMFSLGKEIEIDSNKYIAAGVETFAVYIIHDVGILVKPIEQQ